MDSGTSADFVQSWLARGLPHGPHPRVVRPINYVKIITTTVGVLGGLTALTVAAPYLLPIIQNRNLWAALSLIAILLFTSGHMFNHIRKVPYVAGDGKGKVSYFAGGFQNQFGLETQIIAALCEFEGRTIDEECTGADIPCRWCSVIRHYFSGAQGTQDDRCPVAESGRLHLVRRHLWNLQLPHECLQDQERWISILAATILGLEALPSGVDRSKGRRSKSKG